MRLYVTLDIHFDVHRFVVLINTFVAERAQNPQIAMPIVVLHAVNMMCVQTFFFIIHIDPAVCARPIVLLPQSSRNLREVLSVSTSFRILGKGFWQLLHHRQVPVVFLQVSLDYKVIHLLYSFRFRRRHFQPLVLQVIQTVLTGEQADALQHLAGYRCPEMIISSNVNYAYTAFIKLSFPLPRKYTP